MSAYALRVIDCACESLDRSGVGSVGLRQARAYIADYLSAVKEYEAAIEAMNCCESWQQAELAEGRVHRAEKRKKLALARVQGGQS